MQNRKIMQIKTLKYITISSFFEDFPKHFEDFISSEQDFCYGTNDYTLISKQRFVNHLYELKERYLIDYSELITKAEQLFNDVYIDLEN